MVRIKALRLYRALHRTAYGFESYEGGPGAINDIPASLLGKLADAGRVVEVPAGTAMVGVPLAPGMDTEN